jgi:hypothetical protein
MLRISGSGHSSIHNKTVRSLSLGVVHIEFGMIPEEDPGASAWDVPKEQSTEDVLQQTLKKEATIQ